MKKLLPAMRVSLGMIMAIVAIIMLSDMLGLIPDRSTAVIDGRKTIAETLAVQYSLAARRNDYDSIESSMKMLVERNDEVLSAALRNANGIIVAVVGDHAEHWDPGRNDKSTPTNMQVPIYRNATLNQKWGTVELRFMPISKVNVFGFSINSLALMTIFVAATGFLVFLLLIKKIFTNIDPSSAVPSRVRKALDTLTEGVMLIDNKGTILFSNEVLADAIGMKESQIIGKKVTSLGWKSDHAALPWVKTLESGANSVGEKIELALTDRDNILFVVNSSPVLNDKGEQQGVMVTFDDVTELEARNDQLRDMVGRLKDSSEKVNQQNEELFILATRDPLTDCLNRRSLFDQFESSCMDAINNDAEFCCLMLDIDHFKAVNDTYGHAAGDEVLRVVSAAIKGVLRNDDEIFRYGGEEFCVLLSGADINAASRLAERVRAIVEAQAVDHAAGGQVISVTISVGLSSIKFGAENLPALIETADAALYESKHNGRNRVTVWSVEGAQAEQAAEVQQLAAEDVSDTEAGADSLAGAHQDIEGNTGLPSRAHFRTELGQIIERARQHGKSAAVLMIGLDMFKRINNVFGYTVGDAVLDVVGKRLKASVRESDAACRVEDVIPEQMVYGLGGDEFSILLTNLESRDDVSIVVERLIDLLANPIVINNQQVPLTCSVGISMFPNDGTDVGTLTTCAGAALQQAKHEGKNRFEFFHNDLVSEVRDDYETEKALRDALENNEFELYYQPQLDVQTLCIESMEALIRWHHPQRGIVMPGEFIPAAERTGQIDDIGRWVINAACQQIRSWLNAGRVLPVAINLSALQFRQKDLIEQINTAVSSARINPKYLQLEITESTIMEELDTALETLQALSRLGYKIAIDDFGTGYSSLKYLKHFPADILKIDRAFIKDVDTDPGDAAIVSAAISMGHGMNLKVVAEGVETEAQLLFLRNLRCDMIQGFLLGVPLPASEAISLTGKEQHADHAS
jgi:diguanylate cyclase (GGDEF)-like protein/PAS domain S-box-containing protein